MSLDRAREYLKKHNLDGKIKEFEASCATVAEAAQAIGCEEKEIAKTLSFYIEDKPILIVAAGDSKVDNAKYKAEFGVKAKMIPFEEVEGMVGHAVGGVCPFGVNDGVKVYLDRSLMRFETVYPACGSSNSVVKLKLEELEKAVGYEKWVDVCKERE